nr:MFS transporter [Georgenia subflava]
MSLPADSPSTAGRREWAALGVLALPALLVSIDVFVLLLAVPHLSADLGASSTEQLWILDIYGFLLAGFMLTMGTLGDRIGRRRLLLIGAAGFAVASVLAAFSVSPAMLIVARALLGVAGATLAPSTLALISNLFRDPAQRAQAIGVWMVCFMGGAAVGPVVGGVMLEHFWWGAAFLLGVPAMLLLLVLGPVLLPEYRDTRAGRIDPASVALSLAAILPAVYGIKELATGGWSTVPGLALVVGLASGLGFVSRQRRIADPVLDLGLFHTRAFSTAVAGMFLVAATGATMYFVTQHLQLVSGLTALHSGLAMLPGVAAAVAGFLLAPALARRIRPAVLIAVGMVVSLSGVSLLVLTGTDELVPLVLAYVLFQLGCGPMVTLGTDLVVGSAPPEKAGSAAATSEAAGELGYALGIAVLGSVAAAAYRAALGPLPEGLTGEQAAAVREGLAGADAVAGALGAEGAALLDSARQAFLAGMDVALAGVALAMVTIAVLALTMLRHVPPSRVEAPGIGPAAEPAGPIGSATGPTPAPHGSTTGPAPAPHGSTTGPAAAPHGSTTGPAPAASRPPAGGTSASGVPGTSREAEFSMTAAHGPGTVDDIPTQGGNHP